MEPPPPSNPFIIISGHNPRQGHRERVSKVKSHLARQKSYLRRHQDRGSSKKLETPNGATEGRVVSRLAPIPDAENALALCAPRIPSQVEWRMPIMSHPLFDPAMIGVETKGRLQKFFDIHMRSNIYVHPFARQAIGWAAQYPHVTSAKLVNASSWDEMQEHGELSPWTISQRHVAVKLLHDFIVNEGVPNLAYVAAIESLLSFEILTDQNNNFHQLWTFFQSILQPHVAAPRDGWEFHLRCSKLLDQSNRLRQMGDHVSGRTKESEASHPHLFNLSVPPQDFSVFTLDLEHGLNDQGVVCGLLKDLYQVVSIAIQLSTSPAASQTVYDYVVSVYNRVLQSLDDPPSKGGVSVSDYELTEEHSPIVAPLRLTVLMLCSCLLYGEYGAGETLARLANRLRGLFESRRTMLEFHTQWSPFVGGLLWCQAIGVRFAVGKRDRTWFLMQFLRISQSYILDDCPNISESIAMVLDGLENITKLSQPVWFV
ncbi:hypothetical protein BX600DRAFT_515788 [Xylariales sp. PMI_506]|nr:hypothetical protein BX600DRAFT_515788 [Xylariales sp. PMI_506]